MATTKSSTRTTKAPANPNKELEKQVKALTAQVQELQLQVKTLSKQAAAAPAPVSQPAGNFVTREQFIQGLRMCGARDRHIKRLQ